MLISLFRNQQRVISLCNNDLSVTRSWPFITHHLRCFLSPGEKEQNCPMMFSVSCARLHGAQEQVPAPRLGHPASKAFQSQPHLSAHQKGFPSGQNLTFLVGKKKVTRRTKPPSSTCFDISKEKLNFFLAMKLFFSVWYGFLWQEVIKVKTRIELVFTEIKHLAHVQSISPSCFISQGIFKF